MGAIIDYLREFWSRLNKLSFLLASLFLSVLIFLNYRYGIEERIFEFDSFWLRLTSWFFLFLFAFTVSYVIDFYIDKQPMPSSQFYFLLILAPSLFAAKMAWRLNTTGHGFLSFPSYEYWQKTLHWPVKAILMTAIVVAVWKFLRLDPPVAGMNRHPGNQVPYFVMLVVMIPLLTLAASTAGFQTVYPKLQSIDHIDQLVHDSTPYQIIYELAYGSDFFTIELFFRGFVVLAFAQFVGFRAVVPMAAFYCAIHFGKPLPECISSFFGGLILGAVVLNTRSIWGGLIVHLGIAWLMEIFGWLARIW